MKKLLIVLAFAGVCMSSMAQDADPTLKYSVQTNSFWSNWFIQANANWSAFYSNEEHGANLPVSPIKSFRSAPNFSVALGKWFSPSIGLRTKFYGIWGRQVLPEEVKHEYKYWNLQEQGLLNLSNIFCGYNPNRVWNVSLFGGLGFERNKEINMSSMSYSLGLMNQFRLCSHVSLNLELGWLYKEHDTDNIEEKSPTDISHAIFWESHDQQLYAELGLTIDLGNHGFSSKVCKTGWKNTPDVDAIKALSQAQIDALNAQLNDVNAENARLRDLLANQKPAPAETQIIKEYACPAISVFFTINKWDIRSKKDLVNIKSMAEFAKENGNNLLVKGYADSATGTPSRNQFLSEKRAETVANELVNMGVSRDNITTEAHGGVLDLSPVSYNRRATVEITK